MSEKHLGITIAQDGVAMKYLAGAHHFKAQKMTFTDYITTKYLQSITNLLK